MSVERGARRIAWGCVALGALAAFAGPSGAQSAHSGPTGASARVLVLEHVNLIDGISDLVRPDVTVVIRGEEIGDVRVTPLPSAPRGATVSTSRMRG